MFDRECCHWSLFLLLLRLKETTYGYRDIKFGNVFVLLLRWVIIGGHIKWGPVNNLTFHICIYFKLNNLICACAQSSNSCTMSLSRVVKFFTLSPLLIYCKDELVLAATWSVRAVYRIALFKFLNASMCCCWVILIFSIRSASVFSSLPMSRSASVIYLSILVNF